MDNKISNDQLKNANAGGFTLIEVLIAMAIFVIGFLAVGSMQIAAVKGNATARIRTEASILAADVIEQLMKSPYDSTAVQGPYNESDPLSAGFHPGATSNNWFSDGIYDVRWEILGNTPVTDTKTVAVTVRWQKRGKIREISYSFVAADANL